VRCLTYADLDAGKLAPKVQKVLAAIERDDFRSPDVKKLAVGPYYRCKLDDASRLLLQFVEVKGQTVCLALEIIAHHAYDKSRFLRGAAVDEAKLVAVDAVAAADRAAMRYAHPTRPSFLLLDKPLSLDDAQDAALRQRPPMVLVGSAGSGKTAVLLNLLRRMGGRVAYVTESRWLAETSRGLYVAFDGAPDDQEADFLSYQQLLESVHVPEGRPVTFAEFQGFFARHQHKVKFADAHAVFEELRGVLTAEPEGPFAKDDYCNLGVRQSLFDVPARQVLYELFERYREWLPTAGLYEPNLVAHQQLAQVEPTYDFIAVDEVQDLTNVQLALILRALRKPGHFVLAGDANQIVHPNYFSWAKVKSLFWRGIGEAKDSSVHVLNVSYRNSQSVTAAANRLLQLKHLRFGSIDRESNRLMVAVGGPEGFVAALTTGTAGVRDLDQRTRLSTDAAVVVLRDAHKAQARKVFGTPLVFSIHEAKGLEYQTVILYRLVAAEAALYAELAEGVKAADLQSDELAYRRAKDKSDKTLELYKFYVNALYVALTRAVRDVVMVEDDPKHPLCALLGVLPVSDVSRVQAAKASAEQWQREAQRLEAQGKREQADAIRKNVLRQVPVPWQVFDAANLPTLWKKAADTKVVSQKLREQMEEFAYLHDEFPTLYCLARAHGQGEVKAEAFEATRQKRARTAIDRAFSKGKAEILRDTERYGVDHRLQVGLTPLMLAAYTGNLGLVEALLDRGASRTVRDHMGRMAMHWALRGAYDGMLQPAHALGAVYDRVAVASFDIDVGDRLLQIGREMGEAMVFHLVVALRSASFGSTRRPSDQFTSAGLQKGAFADLPEVVVKAKRKTPGYLNHVLARACVGSKYTPSRQLWQRVRMGSYQLNPELKLQVADAQGNLRWAPIGEVIDASWLGGHAKVVADDVEASWRQMFEPKPYTPEQLRAARIMAPGWTEAELKQLKLHYSHGPWPGATPEQRKNHENMQTFFACLERGEPGGWRLPKR